MSAQHLNVVQSISPTTAVPGKFVTFSFEMVNVGASLVENVILTDEGLSRPDSGIEISSIQAGETVAVSFQAVVPGIPPEGALGNEALNAES
ncbi:hypothetical protein SAMN05444162_2993 [Paenibacillaceae bacterium GAS479]|nr:hypothetical protein SAMN05444162_2993 [Paenibacillaceae bacterium GAS479]